MYVYVYIYTYILQSIEDGTFHGYVEFPVANHVDLLPRHRAAAPCATGLWRPSALQTAWVKWVKATRATSKSIGLSFGGTLIFNHPFRTMGFSKQNIYLYK